MTREELHMQKRFCDLASQAYSRNVPAFSDFLTLHELHIYQSTRAEFSYIDSETFGGYEFAERQMAAFFPDALCCAKEYPIACLEITPLQAKFSDALTHRDYLGAILNLGIDRCKIGDILIEENRALVFCHAQIAPYIEEKLCRIKHTSVKISGYRAEEIHYEPKIQEITGTVASVRLDSVLALAFRASRSSLVGLIEGGKVFVNGKLITSNGYSLKEEDVVSARGLGRFQYKGMGGQSKKGRSYVILWKYIS